jgi:hypothetical protein
MPSRKACSRREYRRSAGRRSTPLPAIRFEQALDPIEIPVIRNKQRIDQDHGLPRLRRPSRFSAWRHNPAAAAGMADGAVALRRDDRFGNRSGVFPRDTMAEENPDHEAGQFTDADGLWHRTILQRKEYHHGRAK